MPCIDDTQIIHSSFADTIATTSGTALRPSATAALLIAVVQLDFMNSADHSDLLLLLLLLPMPAVDLYCMKRTGCVVHYASQQQ